MSRERVSVLSAGLAMMAAAAGLAGADIPVRYQRDPEIDLTVPGEPRSKFNARGGRRGPMPKPSKDMSSDYRANVQSQWGFTTKRLEALRRDWLKIDAKDRPKWHNYLGHRRNRNHQLEGYQP